MPVGRQEGKPCWEILCGSSPSAQLGSAFLNWHGSLLLLEHLCYLPDNMQKSIFLSTGTPRLKPLLLFSHLQLACTSMGSVTTFPHTHNMQCVVFPPHHTSCSSPLPFGSVMSPLLKKHLNFAYEGKHWKFTWVWLISLNMVISSSTHFPENLWFCSVVFFMAKTP